MYANNVWRHSFCILFKSTSTKFDILNKLKSLYRNYVFLGFFEYGFNFEKIKTWFCVYFDVYSHHCFLSIDNLHEAAHFWTSEINI